MPPASNGISEKALTEIDILRRQRVTLERVTVGLTAVTFAIACVAFSLVLDWQFEWATPEERCLPPYFVLSSTLMLASILSRPERLRKIHAAESRTVDLLLPPDPENPEQLGTPKEERRSRSERTTPPENATPSQTNTRSDQTFALRNRLNAEVVFPKKRLQRAAWLLMVTIAAVSMSTVQTSAPIKRLIHRFLKPLGDAPLTTIALERVPEWVSPGADLEISATLRGKIPESAKLRLRYSTGNIHDVPMPMFLRRVTYTVQNIVAPTSLRIIAGKTATKWIHVTPVGLPTVKDLQLRVFPPTGSRRKAQLYTELPTTIQAIQGSRIAIEFGTERTIASANLAQTWNQENRQVPLIEPEPGRFRTTWEVLASHSFSLQLKNVLGQENTRQVTTVTLEPLPIPAWKELQPATDTRFIKAGPWKFEAVLTSAELVTRWGLSLQGGQDAQREIVLGENPEAASTLSASHEVEAKDFCSGETSTLTWFFWYEQDNPHEKPSRRNGDLFFGTLAEQGSTFSQADSYLVELLRLQQQSMTALWNFQRKLNAASGRHGYPPAIAAELDEIEQTQRRVQSLTTERLLQFQGGLLLTNRLREAESILVRLLAALRKVRSDESQLEALIRSQRLAYDALYMASVETPKPSLDRNR